jgi:hypothetical protein
MTEENYFLQMIQRIRQHEEIMLYGNVLHVSGEEAVLVSDYLQTEFKRESLHYPSTSPEYNPTAALWAAKTVYRSAQLILYRENSNEDLQLLLPDYEQEIDAAAILSADLCLRFVPHMIRTLINIDSEDRLIHVLESKLKQWHFSGITWERLDFTAMDFSSVSNNPSLHQLYCERIINHRNITLARHPVFNEAISAQLGLYHQDLWKDFKRTTLLS